MNKNMIRTKVNPAIAETTEQYILNAYTNEENGKITDIKFQVMLRISAIIVGNDGKWYYIYNRIK